MGLNENVAKLFYTKTYADIVDSVKVSVTVVFLWGGGVAKAISLSLARKNASTIVQRAFISMS